MEYFLINLRKEEGKERGVGKRGRGVLLYRNNTCLVVATHVYIATQYIEHQVCLDENYTYPILCNIYQALKWFICLKLVRSKVYTHAVTHSVKCFSLLFQGKKYISIQL